jgi:hypothetical protein
VDSNILFSIRERCKWADEHSNLGLAQNDRQVLLDYVDELQAALIEISDPNRVPFDPVSIARKTLGLPVGWCISSNLDHMNAHEETDSCVDWRNNRG